MKSCLTGLSSRYVCTVHYAALLWSIKHDLHKQALPISKYSEKTGDTVCGGCVSSFEALLLRRQLVGWDCNTRETGLHTMKPLFVKWNNMVGAWKHNRNKQR